MLNKIRQVLIEKCFTLKTNFENFKPSEKRTRTPMVVSEDIYLKGLQSPKSYFDSLFSRKYGNIEREVLCFGNRFFENFLSEKNAHVYGRIRIHIPRHPTLPYNVFRVVGFKEIRQFWNKNYLLRKQILEVSNPFRKNKHLGWSHTTSYNVYPVVMFKKMRRGWKKTLHLVNNFCKVRKQIS